MPPALGLPFYEAKRAEVPVGDLCRGLESF